jgi:hypothetical protein
MIHWHGSPREASYDQLSRLIDNVNVFEGPELEQEILDLGLDEGIPPIVEQDVAEEIVNPIMDPAPVDMVPAIRMARSVKPTS